MTEPQISTKTKQHWKYKSLLDLLQGENIDKLRLNDLKNICDAYGVEYSHFSTKDQIVMLIKAQGNLRDLIEHNLPEVAKEAVAGSINKKRW